MASFSSHARWVDFFGLTFGASGAAGSATAVAAPPEAGVTVPAAGAVEAAGEAGVPVAAVVGDAGALGVVAAGDAGTDAVGGFAGDSGAASSGISMAPWTENQNSDQDAGLKPGAPKRCPTLRAGLRAALQNFASNKNTRLRAMLQKRLFERTAELKPGATFTP